jgi:hypothetical protein
MLEVACERQIACGVSVANQALTLDDCMKGCDDAAAVVEAAPLAVREASLSACRDALQNASCTTLANRRMQPVAQCADLYVGTRGPGEACTENGIHDECVDTYECVSVGGSLCGTCQPKPPKCVEGGCGYGKFCDDVGRCENQAQLGDACELPTLTNLWDRTCVDGAFCGDGARCVAAIDPGQTCGPLVAPYECKPGYMTQSSCIDGRCQLARQQGEACGSYEDCAAPLFCDAGTCQPRGVVGSFCSDWVGACQDGLDCVSGKCALHVDPETLPPTPRGLLHAGARCDGAGAGICPLGQTCACDDGGCAEMHCADALPLGASCKAKGTDQGVKEDPFDPTRCASGGYCDILSSWTCVAPQLPGGPCDFQELTQTMQCTTLLCQDHVCKGLDDPTCR